jgi:hypothetical protein
MMKHARIALAALALTVASVVNAATFNLFQPANGILVGNPSTYVTTAATSSTVISLWSGTCNSSTFLRGDGACAAAGGNPAGTSGQMQYNNGGVFAGAKLYYDPNYVGAGIPAFTLGDGANATAAVFGPTAANATSAGGTLVVKGAAGGATSGNGGAVQYNGGDATSGTGGTATLSGGAGTLGGNVMIAGGIGGAGGVLDFWTAGSSRLQIAGNGEWTVSGDTGSASQVLTWGASGPTWETPTGGVSLGGTNTWTAQNTWSNATPALRLFTTGAATDRKDIRLEASASGQLQLNSYTDAGSLMNSLIIASRASGGFTTTTFGHNNGTVNVAGTSLVLQANGGSRMTVASNGQITTAAPSAGGPGFTINGPSVNGMSLYVHGDAGTGTSNGVQIDAGTNASDAALTVQDVTASTNFLTIDGAGSATMGNAQTAQGAGTLNAGGLYVAGNAVCQANGTNCPAPGGTSLVPRSFSTTDNTQSTDCGKVLLFTGAGSQTLTLDSDPAVNCVLTIVNAGSGSLSVAATALSWYNGSGTIGSGTRTIAVGAVVTATVFTTLGSWSIWGGGIL